MAVLMATRTHVMKPPRNPARPQSGAIASALRWATVLAALMTCLFASQAAVLFIWDGVRPDPLRAPTTRWALATIVCALAYRQVRTAADSADPAADRTIHSHIKNLRRKLAAAGADTSRIESVYGAGYRFEAHTV